ncbi:hypothetical protein Tco_0263365, partial [Tanacetum coccineum]
MISRFNIGLAKRTTLALALKQNFYEPNLCYISISSGFDQFQPSQFPVIHQPPQEMSIQDMEDLKQQYLDEIKKKASATRACGQSLDLSFATFQFFCYDDDDDDDDEEYTIAITPFLPTEEPDNSLSMGDEHLITILETESDELIKSSVENLVPFPSDS